MTAHPSRWPLVVVAAACGVTASIAAPRAQDATATRFDAASVKPNRSALPGIEVGTAGGRFTAMNAPALLLIRLAYGVPENRIVGAPDWLRNDRFDVVATTGGAVSREQQNLMLQTLLRERFSLAARMETRERPLYLLVRARPDDRPAAGLGRSSVDCTAAIAAMRKGGAPLPPSNRILCGSRVRPGGLSVGGLTMREIAAEVISPRVDRPVIDRTGLDGSFDFDLDFAPPPTAASPATDAPSIFTALDEQLGLRLEPAQGPIDVLVIDRIERPRPD